MGGNLEYWLYLIIAPLLGGVLAAAGFIAAKKPSAGELIGKLVPYQAFVGVGMMVVFVLMAIDGFIGASFDMLDFKALIGLVWIGTVFSNLLVGFLLGFGLVAQWIPGEGSVETKALEIQKKLINVQVPLGFVALVCAFMNLVFKFKYFS